MAPKKNTKVESVSQAPAPKVVEPVPSPKLEEEELSEVESDEEEQTTEQESSEKKTRARRTVTKDSFFQSLSELVAQVDSEIKKLGEASGEKPKGLRFIKRIRKALHVVESDARKVMKFKNANKKSGSVSGFMKPVFISEEMASFTGLDKATPYPRPQITSTICKYIEANSLQNPADRREFRVDSQLQKLLRYNPAQPPKDEEGKVIPMTYFRLQKYMQHHFKADTTTVAPLVVPTTPTAAPVVHPEPTPVVAVTAASSKRKAK